MEAPAHAILEGFDLGQRRSRNHDQRDVAIGEVNEAAVEMIGQERAAWTTLLPPRTEHEVVHNQLASAVEEVGERFLAVRTIEDILFFNPLPGHFAALLAQFLSLIHI